MRTVKEIALKIENKPGTLLEISKLLGSNGITILGLTLRTDGDQGLLYFVSRDPSRTVRILESAGYSPKTAEILATSLPPHPGSFDAVLKTLKLASVNIEHLYTSSAVGDLVLLGVDDLTKAHDALKDEWFELHGEELYNM
ncbi:ACT domain-containing protein [Thermodesulfobacteriota bacterium]